MNSLQAKPRKEPNDQIFTFQANLAVLTLRYMNSLSAAGEAQKGAKSQACRFDIAPYEQFISGWPSQERSQMTRSFTFQAKLAVLTLRHMSSLSAAGQAQKGAKSPDLYISSKAGRFDIAPYEQFISGRPSPERSQITRSLRVKPGWLFRHCAI